MSENMNHYVNISAYKFISIDNCEVLKPLFLAKCQELNLKGTIILSPEGINMFLAGLRHEMDAYYAWLHQDARFADVVAKESWSDSQPFTKLLVKIKPEIITMRMPLIKPELGRAPAVDAHTLKRWLDQGHDDQGKAVVMVDTRNDFEVDVGSFDHTIDYRISKFTEFPEIIEQHRADFADKTVVTFCTGGIRCEKAAIHMQNVGFDSVFQLEGGILKYFEEVGGAHYHGDCFVFDYRTALTPTLAVSDIVQCYACRAVVSAEEQQSEWYIPGKSCPHCQKQAKTAATSAHAPG